MKGYWIGHLSVINPEAHMRDYVPRSSAAIARFGGRFLVRGGDSEITEGSCNDSHIIIEFDSYQTALDCYHSAEYAEARAIRANTAKAYIIVVEGIGPDKIGAAWPARASSNPAPYSIACGHSIPPI